MKALRLIISCEHGGNDIPPRYQPLFSNHINVLETHQGLDIGALAIAKALSERFSCPLYYTTVSRLLIDCNRSLHNPRCFSEFSKSLSKNEKKVLIDTYYLPYRQQVEKYIANNIQQGLQVLHLSIHSFTPTLHGQIRHTAIGLLYDSSRHAEKEIATRWQNILLRHPTAYRIRLNYPYLGKNDGLTTAIRKHHTQKEYLGIEVEINQQLLNDDASCQQVVDTLATTLNELLALV